MPYDENGKKKKLKKIIERNKPRGCSVLNELLAMDQILQQKIHVSKLNKT
jgi:hypothetical protein